MKRRKPTAARKKRQSGFDQPKEVRSIARERVGRVKASQVIVPKKDRKPKHKPPAVPEES